VGREVHVGAEAGKGRRAVPDVHGAARREAVIRSQLDEAVEDGEGARVGVLEERAFELAVRTEIGLRGGRRTPIGLDLGEAVLARRRVITERQRAPRVVAEEDAFTIVGQAVDGDGARGAEDAHVPAIGQTIVRLGLEEEAHPGVLIHAEIALVAAIGAAVLRARQDADIAVGLAVEDRREGRLGPGGLRRGGARDQRGPDQRGGSKENSSQSDLPSLRDPPLAGGAVGAFPAAPAKSRGATLKTRGWDGFDGCWSKLTAV